MTLADYGHSLLGTIGVSNSNFENLALSLYPRSCSAGSHLQKLCSELEASTIGGLSLESGDSQTCSRLTVSVWSRPG